MSSILFFIVGIALGFYIKSKTTSASKSDDELDEMRAEAHEALRERTEQRKERILNFMNIDAAHEEELKACNVVDIKEGITSENVTKLLGVASKTARKYLNELEDENKIKQHGERGRNVFYTLI